MRFRKLRITWSVACGVFCLLLIMLWVRSYWCEDCLLGPSFKSAHLQVCSVHGGIAYVHYDDPAPFLRWRLATFPPGKRLGISEFRWQVVRGDFGRAICFPIWFPAALSTFFAI